MQKNASPATALCICEAIPSPSGFLNLLPVKDAPGLPTKTLLLAMKLTALIMLLSCLHVFAGVHSQTITLSGKDIPLKRVFQQVKQQTGYTIFGSGSLLKQTRNISITVSNMPLEQFLDSIFLQQPITYRILDGTNIFFFKKTDITQMPVRNAATGPSSAADLRKIITGTVVGENGSKVEGASVKVKGSDAGVITDAGGKFTIYLELGQVLVFSHVNMITREVKASDFPANGIIVMKQKDATLDNVVVTGYGNIRKESFTGTYTQLTKADILKVSPNNLIAALQAYDPSFRIMQNENMGSNPNVMPEFYIRGQSGFPGVKDLDKIQSGSDVSQFSLRNNPNIPIFIMDGFEVSVEKIYDLDISRINNITILKDAAATAMYGSRASNGVVVIETIVPKPGQFRVNYNGIFSVTSPDLSSYNLMNAQEKLDAEMAAKVYLPSVPESDPNYQRILIENLWHMEQKKNEIRKGVNTNWLAQPLNTMFNSRHNMFIEGGSEAVRLGLDLKYDNQNGVMKKSFRNRISAGLTLQYQTRNLQIRNQAYFDRVKAEESPYGSFSDYTSMQPYYAMYDEQTGMYQKKMPFYLGTSPVNPLHEATVGNFNRSGYKEFTDNLSANFTVNKFLQLKAQFAIDYKDAATDRFTSPESAVYGNTDPFNKGQLTQTSTKTLDWNTNIFGSYNRNIDANNINISVGINAKSTNEDFITASYAGFPGSGYYSPAYASQILRKPELSDNKRRLFGSFATVNYSYKDIYLFDGSVRMDGSSEFGTDRKWAPFWSLGTGINLHNTEWLKNNSAISMFRITGNIGQTGKSNFSPYMARNTYEIMLDDWYPTGIGSGLIYMGNNKLTWEKQVSWNLGTMFSWKKLFTIEFNYYNKETYDLITDVSLPSSAGFSVYRDNVGKVLNKGFEIKSAVNVINQRDLNIILNANMAHNRNRIVEIAESMKRYNKRIDEYYQEYIVASGSNSAANELNAKFSRPVMKYEEGGSLTNIFGMRSLGIDPATGKELFLKRDGSVTNDWDPMEQQVIGNSEPWAQGSFGLNVRYKKFTLFTTFLYEFGGDQYNHTLVNNVENVNLITGNADKRVLTQRWQKPGDMVPLKSIEDRYLITRPTSRFIQQNNFISFNSLSLAYDFDPAMLKKFGLRTFRTTLMMNDVALFSTIKREMGLDYPFARTITLTINASF